MDWGGGMGRNFDLVFQSLFIVAGETEAKRWQQLLLLPKCYSKPELVQQLPPTPYTERKFPSASGSQAGAGNLGGKGAGFRQLLGSRSQGRRCD